MKHINDLIININSIETSCIHIKHSKINNFYIKRHAYEVGNIYIGKVSNILPNLSSAFIKLSNLETGFLQFSTSQHNMEDLSACYDNQSLNEEETWSVPPDNVENLKLSQKILVQISKDASEGKGAKLTHHISVPGRFLVLIISNKTQKCISRKIISQEAKNQLQEFMNSIEPPTNTILISRTAAQHATWQQLQDEFQELSGIHTNIIKEFQTSTKPTCVYKMNLFLKNIIFSAIDNEISRIIINDLDTYKFVLSMIQHYAIKHKSPPIVSYKDNPFIFEEYNLQNEIDTYFQKRVWLPSGGYLIIESTLSMHTIDVNSGRSIGSEKTSSVTMTILKTNLEAAQEIPRQIRIRNLGGIIICDFIDMSHYSHRKRILEAFKTHMKEDPAVYLIMPINEICIIEITRQKQNFSINQITCTECPTCNGLGVVKNTESIFLDITKFIGTKLLSKIQPNAALTLYVHPSIKSFFTKKESIQFLHVVLQHKTTLITIKSDKSLSMFSARLECENLKFLITI